MTHADKILAFLELHPGSTNLEITLATGIGSPHRRITGKETPKGWRLRTEKRGKLFVHFADRLDGEGEREGFQGAFAPGPHRADPESQGTFPSVVANPPAPSVEPDDESALESEALAVSERLGFKPHALSQQEAR